MAEERSWGVRWLPVILLLALAVMVLVGQAAITTEEGCRAHAFEQGWTDASSWGLGIGFCF